MRILIRSRSGFLRRHCSHARTFATSKWVLSSSTSATQRAATVSAVEVKNSSPEEAKEKRHHNKDGGYVNPWDSWVKVSIPPPSRDFLWRYFTGRVYHPDPDSPTLTVRVPQFLPSRQTDNLRATWLGHACYYVEFLGGLRVLFDPVFSERCSPFTWLGPKRFTKAPCQVEDIPIIDAVIISHSHYDHLDHSTITKIYAKHPNVHFFCPLGLEKWFNDVGIREVTELDWWEERELAVAPTRLLAQTSSLEKTETIYDEDGVRIHARIGCLPCQHTSGRTLSNKWQTLWSSWSVETGGKKLWFGGDTGYRSVPELPEGEDDYAPDKNYPHCPVFKQIGDLRGPFDLGLIPIGAYKPRLAMSPVHGNPFDSVNIFKDTKCKRAMGIHWGTWDLTEEDRLEPPRLLKKALAGKGLPQEGVFDVCDVGESREFV